MGSNTHSNTPSPPGNFSYPPPGSKLHFNRVDSLVISWLTFDPNATGCLLSIWYWPWVDHSLPKIGYNRTAPANGTALVPLNVFSKSFPATLNFDYNASDGSHQKISSPIFSVDDSPQSRAVTWSQGVLAAPTPSPSAVPQTSISASLLMSSVSTASAPSSTLSISKLSSTSSPHLGNGAIASTASAAPSALTGSKSSTISNSRMETGAIAGIVVGIVVCVGLAGSLVFYRRRKPNKIQAEIQLPPPANSQSTVPVNLIREKDATPLPPLELSGDGQLVEMATSYHGR